MVVHELAHGFYEDIAIFLTLALLGGLIAFFRNVRSCLDKQSARTLRLMKAMQVLASEIDKQSIRNHPKEVSTFADDVDRILKDEQGNL